eukprot:11114654-Alexandrium_andersonii.AAC.1
MQQKLFGNGMHLAVLAAWHWYVLAHCLRRDTIAEFLPDLRMFSAQPTPPAEPAVEAAEASSAGA